MRILNRPGSYYQDNFSSRLSFAEVRLLDKNGIILQKQILGDTTDKLDIYVTFDRTPPSTSVVAWGPADSTGSPRLSDDMKLQIKAQLKNALDLFDTSIALLFGNKTTVGQVCAFAQGLRSNTVTSIPGFCCLDAPYQSKIEEWGEKVSSWNVKINENRYCDVTEKN